MVQHFNDAWPAGVPKVFPGVARMKTLGLYSIGEAAVRLMIQATTGGLNCCGSAESLGIVRQPNLVCAANLSSRQQQSRRPFQVNGRMPLFMRIRFTGFGADSNGRGSA